MLWSMQRAEDIVQQLSASRVYKEYEKAFSSATQLPLALRPQVVWGHCLSGKEHQNPLCRMLEKSNRCCAACLMMQQQTGPESSMHTVTLKCFAGLYDTAIPVRLGDRTIGFLQTGQVALSKPTAARFQKLAKQLKAWGVPGDLHAYEEAYYRTPVLPKSRYAAYVSMLEIFAEHLSLFANHLIIFRDNSDSPLISRAKRYIDEHSTEDVRLESTAHALHVSTFYFCKLFKKVTGMTFTEYVSRTRVEKAKSLLMNPNMRVTEAAFSCGFSSLTNFNRAFKRITGLSPTSYRSAAKKSWSDETGDRLTAA